MQPTLHTTLATGTAQAELLQLAVYLHVHVTRPSMLHAGAPTDLQRRVIFLARRMAQERDEVTTLAVAGYAVAGALLSGVAFEAGKAALDSLTLPPTTADTAGLVCALTVCHAYAAVRDGRPGDATAPMDAAAEVAGRFGATRDIDSLGFMHTPANTRIDRMWLALETDDPDQAVSIAQEMRPEHHPFPLVRAKYWTHYGKALTQLRGRHEDAVRALRTAENIFPTKVRRDPIVREAIAVLLPRTRRDSPAGRELHDMAYRAGLPM